MGTCFGYSTGRFKSYAKHWMFYLATLAQRLNKVLLEDLYLTHLVQEGYRGQTPYISTSERRISCWH